MCVCGVCVHVYVCVGGRLRQTVKHMSLPGRGHLADSAMVVIAMQWSIVWIIHTPKTHKPAALQLARGTAAIWRGGGPPRCACKFSLLGREDSRRCCHSACLSTCLTFQFACLFDFCTNFASWRFFLQVSSEPRYLVLFKKAD